MIAFFSLREYYEGDGVACETLFQCLLTTIDYGIRNGGGIGDALEPIDISNEGKYVQRFLFDITFFIIVIIILLNIVFGIILYVIFEKRKLTPI